MSARQAIPIIRLHDNLIVSIQVDLSDVVVAQLKDDVSMAVSGSSATGLIIDVSSVEILDSYITRCLRDLAVSAKLMGVATVLSGLRPSVVITLVEMGLELPGLATALNLEHAVELLARAADSSDVPAPQDSDSYPLVFEEELGGE